MKNNRFLAILGLLVLAPIFGMGCDEGLTIVFDDGYGYGSSYSYTEYDEDCDFWHGCTYTYTTRYYSYKGGAR